jgi:hypothetical protein
MVDFSKRLRQIILVYLLSVPVIILLGLLNEGLGHALLFVSSAFLSVGIMYETWIGCHPLRDIEYPSPKEIPRLRTLEYWRDVVGKASGGRKRSFNVLMNHLRHIYLDRILHSEHPRRIDVEEFLTEQREIGLSTGDAELVSLLLAKDPGTKEERFELLCKILEKLED